MKKIILSLAAIATSLTAFGAATPVVNPAGATPNFASSAGQVGYLATQGTNYAVAVIGRPGATSFFDLEAATDSAGVAVFKVFQTTNFGVTIASNGFVGSAATNNQFSFASNTFAVATNDIVGIYSVANDAWLVRLVVGTNAGHVTTITGASISSNVPFTLTAGVDKIYNLGALGGGVAQSGKPYNGLFSNATNSGPAIAGQIVPHVFKGSVAPFFQSLLGRPAAVYTTVQTNASTFVNATGVTR